MLEANQPLEGQVIVTDIRMPFGSMIIFMVKWAFAAIPAFIILSVVGLIITIVFYIVLAGLGIALSGAVPK